ATVTGITCLGLKDCDHCSESALIPIEEDSIASFQQQMMDNGILIEDNSVSRYLAYTEAVDSLNARYSWTVADPEFVQKESYGDFFVDGKEFPSNSYVRYIDHFIHGMDSAAFLISSNDFSAEYGFGTNVRAEFKRYKKSIDRYND